MRYYYKDFEIMFDTTMKIVLLLKELGKYEGHTTLVFENGYIVTYEISSKS